MRSSSLSATSKEAVDSDDLSEKQNPTLGASTADQDLHIDKLDELPAQLNADDDKEGLSAVLEPQPDPVSVIKLFRFATKTDILLAVLGSVCSVAAGVIAPVMTIVFSSLIQALIDFNTYVLQNETDKAHKLLDHESRKYCLWFFILGLIQWVVSYGVNACWAVAAENQGLRIRELYYLSIMRQDIGWFDTVKTGALTTRITNDVNLVQDGLSEKFGFVFMNLVSFLTGFIIAFVKGWDIALICLCILPFMIAAAAYTGRKISHWVTNAQDHTAGSGAVADEAFNGQAQNIQDAYLFGRKKGFVLGAGFGVIHFFIFIMYCAGFNFGIWRIYNNVRTPQEILNAIFALLIGGFSLSGMAPNLSAITTAQGSAAKVFATIDRVSPINPLDTETGKKVDSIDGNIEFKDVYFSYPSRPDVPILKGFNLEIRSGQKIALVGESGCGKSTTIGLIERFYDPASGDVLIDGINIKDYNIGSLRHRFGIVTQEPVLFSTSIIQNIKWGAIDPENNPPTDEEIIEAAKAANAHQFISQLPNGYNTLVGEGGALLSGGQKQRIAIARAIVRNPDVLLLDEATSALDSASERLVQDALDKLSADRTTISIAHRLSTIRNCDQIYVVRDGLISENGTHDELVHRGGEYAAMVHAQELRQSVRIAEQGSADDGEEDVDELIAKELKEQALDLKATTTRQTIDSSKCSSTDASTSAKTGKRPKSLEQSSDFYLLWRLLNQYRGSMRAAIPGTILSIINGAVMPCFALVYSRLIISLSYPDRKKMKHDATMYACLFLIFSITDLLAMFGRAGLFHIAGESLTRKIRYELFRKYLSFEAGYYDDENNGIGMLTARLAADAENVNKVVGTVLSTFVSTMATVITAIAIAFTYDWRLALLGFAQFMQARTKAYERSGQAAAESIRNIKTVVTLRREETFIKSFNEHNRGPHKGNLKGALTTTCNLFINSLLFYAGSQFMTNVMMATTFSSMAIGMLAQFSTMVAKGAVASRGIYMTLDRESPINGMDTEGQVSEKFEGNVKFADVTFSYPIRPDTKILKGISFDALVGKSVALVGASGSGKSTSILLAQRLYDVRSGSVCVEDIDVRDWSVTALRDSIAIVGQEPVLFNYTIGENIAYGKPGATQQDIEEAAKEANIYNFVINLPDGFNTSVGQKGGKLSGGQKQRVAIARALVRKPKLLLLDEATAALDSRSEKVVQRVLDKAAKERTTLTVAHRLSTIQNCDMIVVFKGGRIVERGTHDELLANKGGHYSLLVQQQSLQVMH
ncbi:P-loop containing nucleoside triphosphate hydrolase protein [Coemansia spiralis]|nr:P-loop containing nucleoside triphosphate hydrolase protein [Coemansia spiralis]